jgi:sialate O-acetylesterase
MIAPLAGLGVRGVIWYQGETNTAYPEQYDEVLTGLITSWRDAWKQGDFPFLIVQLAAFDSGTRDWPTLREAQARVARDVPDTGLALAIDVGEPKDIHPKDKLTVGKRLALVARKVAYGEDVVASGPAFKSAEVSGDKVTIHFDHVDGGLKTRGGVLEGFELAGVDGKFIAAEGTISGDQIVLSAPGIAAPTEIRYAWANVPKCSLYNSSDLPAVPFRASLKAH